MSIARRDKTTEENSYSKMEGGMVGILGVLASLKSREKKTKIEQIGREQRCRSRKSVTSRKKEFVRRRIDALQETAWRVPNVRMEE